LTLVNARLCLALQTSRQRWGNWTCESRIMAHRGVTRREVLSASAAMSSSFVVGSAASDAKTIARKVPWAPGVASAPRAVTPGPYRFFNADEATFIDAAVARLIPADELGPGAKEAGATTFIDR
jgi:gluconate 2-dehydrogenase gamma chain